MSCLHSAVVTELTLAQDAFEAIDWVSSVHHIFFASLNILRIVLGTLELQVDFLDIHGKKYNKIGKKLDVDVAFQHFKLANILIYVPHIWSDSHCKIACNLTAIL